MTRWIVCAALCGALFLPGCITYKPKSTYYTIDMTPAATAPAPVNLSVEAIRLDEALSRKDILILVSPIEVEYYAHAQWVAALDQLVREKLHAEFGERDPEVRSLYLSIDLLAFEQRDTAEGAQAAVRMHVSYHRERNGLYEEPLFERTYDLSTPAASPTASAVVEGLSRLLEQIAAQIAADAAALPQE